MGNVEGNYWQNFSSLVYKLVNRKILVQENSQKASISSFLWRNNIGRRLMERDLREKIGNQLTLNSLLSLFLS